MEAAAEPHLRGYPRLYIDHVLQAHEGCDFDFLRPKNEDELEFVPPSSAGHSVEADAASVGGRSSC